MGEGSVSALCTYCLILMPQKLNEQQIKKGSSGDVLSSSVIAEFDCNFNSPPTHRG